MDPTVAFRSLHSNMNVIAPIPNGKTMPPPKLTRDTPRADVLHPVDVDPSPAIRVELHFAIADDLSRRFGQLVHLHEPLEGDQRLNALARTVREGHNVRVVLHPADQSERLKVLDDLCLSLAGCHPCVTASVFTHAPVLADYTQLWELVAASDLKVIRVMAWSDLQSSRAEVELDVIVRDDRDQAVRKWKRDLLADQVLVALIIGMDGNSNVGKHRLGPNCGDNKLPAPVRERIGNLNHLVCHFTVLNLKVADG
ncbi:unannotated protein [freshwater metagenome]|uniref:Unannotated protein n=1 Tax=freshwater metagenome TaxID=449393 RepID=A0A6J7EFT4_9ZZZZ